MQRNLLLSDEERPPLCPIGTSPRDIFQSGAAAPHLGALDCFPQLHTCRHNRGTNPEARNLGLRFSAQERAILLLLHPNVVHAVDYHARLQPRRARQARFHRVCHPDWVRLRRLLHARADLCFFRNA